MKKIAGKFIGKFIGVLVKSSIIALASKLLLMMISKEKKMSLEKRIDGVIDEKGDRAKDLAKRGAHKTFALLDETSTKVSQIDEKKKASA